MGASSPSSLVDSLKSDHQSPLRSPVGAILYSYQREPPNEQPLMQALPQHGEAD